MRFNIDEKLENSNQDVSSVKTPTIESLLSSLKDISSLQAEMKDKIQTQFEIATQNIFTLVPQIKSINWLQYSAYFNDGDECRFYVRAISFLSFIPEYASYDYEAENEEDIIVAEYGSKNLNKLSHEQLVALNTVSDFISLNDDLMKDLYDNHVSVQIIKNNTAVTPYEHD